jgi:hypothetical protein
VIVSRCMLIDKHKKNPKRLGLGFMFMGYGLAC